MHVLDVEFTSGKLFLSSTSGLASALLLRELLLSSPPLGFLPLEPPLPRLPLVLVALELAPLLVLAMVAVVIVVVVVVVAVVSNLHQM